MKAIIRYANSHLWPLVGLQEVIHVLVLGTTLVLHQANIYKIEQGRISLLFSACSHVFQSTSMQPRLRPLIYLWNALVKSPMGSLELLSHTCILWMQQFTQSVQPREHWEHAWPWIVVVVGYDLNQAETFKLILSPLLIGQVSRDKEFDWSVLKSNERAELGV